MPAPLPPIATGQIVRESLPNPVVHYPNRHGTFFAFGRDRKTRPVLCACARGAVENLLRLYRHPSRRSAFRSATALYFPDAVSGMLAGWSGRIPWPIEFQTGLCHQCNHRLPTLRYCDEIEGDIWMQSYGWYVNLTYLRLGMLPSGRGYLAEQCPSDVRADLEALRKAEIALLDECTRLLDAFFSRRPDSPHANGMRLDRLLSNQDSQRIAELRSTTSRVYDAIQAKVEGIARQEGSLSA